MLFCVLFSSCSMRTNNYAIKKEKEYKTFLKNMYDKYWENHWC